MKKSRKCLKELVILLIVIGLIFVGLVGSSMAEDKYIQAAKEAVKEIGSDTVLTPEQLEDELTWFAKTSAPYRGKTITAAYESAPLTDWEEKVLVPMFEKITGIKVLIEGMSGDDTMVKIRLEVQTKAGAYDTISIDQDCVGMFSTKGGAVNLTKFMEDNPQLVSPSLDLEDYTANMISRNPWTGDLYILNDYQKATGTVYRKDWFTNPQYQKEFKEKYGYELKTPMEWFLAAMKTKNVRDDWTIQTSLDVAEFFTRPEETMYGTITGTKPGWHLAWYTNDLMGRLFGFGDIASGPPLSSLPPVCRPHTWTYGVYFDGDEMKGASVKRGGRLNGPRGAAMWDYFIYQLPKYSPPGTAEIDVVEAWVKFGVYGNSAFTLQHMCMVPTYLAPDSKVKGKFEIAPPPVDERWFEHGMVRGYWDTEGWIITEGSKNKEATWLFAQFMTSKSVDVWKNLIGLMPQRYSSINSKQLMAHDEEWGGLISLYKNKDFTNGCAGTDEMWPGFPDTNEIVSTAVAEGMGKKMSPQEIADLVAERLDGWLLKQGLIKE